MGCEVLPRRRNPLSTALQVEPGFGPLPHLLLMLSRVQEQVCFLCQLKSKNQDISVTKVSGIWAKLLYATRKTGSLLEFFVLLIKYQ